MAKRLWVCNIPFTAAPDEVEYVFAEFGTVHEVTIATEQYSGRSRGFGFVTIDTKTPVAEMDGTMLGGRRLTVQEARPKGRNR